MIDENKTVTIPVDVLLSVIRKSVETVMSQQNAYVAFGNNIVGMNTESVAEQIARSVRVNTEIIKHLETEKQ